MSCLIGAGGLGIAFAETIQRSQFASEPLERSGDAPMFIWRTGASEPMISQHGAFISYQVNVDSNGQNITGDAANEPSIAVDPTDRNKMVIGWRQFNSVSSNFRQAGWGFTANGGVSWMFPGVLQNNVFRSDPVLFSNDIGRFFYLSLLNTFFDDMWRSDNGGLQRRSSVASSKSIPLTRRLRRRCRSHRGTQPGLRQQAATILVPAGAASATSIATARAPPAQSPRPRPSAACRRRSDCTSAARVPTRLRQRPSTATFWPSNRTTPSRCTSWA